MISHIEFMTSWMIRITFAYALLKYPDCNQTWRFCPDAYYVPRLPRASSCQRTLCIGFSDLKRSRLLIQLVLTVDLFILLDYY